MARDEGWLAEHMLILDVESPQLFTRFGDHLPREMEIERELQLARLFHSPKVWDLSATSPGG